MKLVDLRLKFFRQHRDTLLSFSDGLTGLFGPNGTGKTTVVEAIAFALFGTKTLRGKIDGVRSFGAKSGEECGVSIGIEHDGRRFRIERSLTDAKLYVGGEAAPLADGGRAVTDRVSQLLGMNYEEFSAAYFTEQKGLDFLSGQVGRAERERFIIRMMGYDKLEQAQQLLRDERRDKKNLIAGAAASLGSKAEIEQRIAAEQRALMEIETKYKEAEGLLAAAQRDAERARDDFQRAEERKGKFDLIAGGLTVLKARESDWLDRLQKLSQEIGRIKKLLGVSDGTPLEPDKLRQELDESLVQERRYRDEREEVQSLHREQVARLEAQLAVIQAQSQEAKLHAASHSKLGAGGSCPTCGQGLGESFSRVKDQARANVERLKSEIEALKQGLKALAVPKRLAELDQLLNSLSAKHSKLKDQIALIASQQHERAILIKSEAEFGELTAAHQKLTNEIVKKVELQGESKHDQGSYLSIKGRFDSTSRLYEVARLQRVKLEGELGTKHAMLKRSTADLENWEVKSVDLKRAQEELFLLEESDTVLNEFRQHVNALIRPRLAELASEFLAELTDGRYTTVEIREDFSPLVLEDGLAKPVISGGEEDLLNLCLRLALSQMLTERAGQSLNFLVLDEVFGSLDEGRRINVLLLLEKLRKRFEQIVLITHLEDIKESIDNPIYLDFSDGVSKVDSTKFEDLGLVENI